MIATGLYKRTTLKSGHGRSQTNLFKSQIGKCRITLTQGAQASQGKRYPTSTYNDRCNSDVFTSECSLSSAVVTSVPIINCFEAPVAANSYPVCSVGRALLSN